jgi:hypothetical protein
VDQGLPRCREKRGRCRALPPLELARFPCPFCGGEEVHHQVLRCGIRSWACRCGWWQFSTSEGVVEEQDRRTWEACRRWAGT